MAYQIEVSITGGVTGNRTAWVKLGGKVAQFTTAAEANAKAAELRATTGLKGGITPSGRPIAIATYVVRQVP